MLNPFHGTVNVLDIGGADAVSRDGLRWSLCLQGQVDRELADDGSEVEVALPDIKFGTWSEAEGLRRAPVRSVVDYAWLDALGSQLLAAVKQRSPGVPFPAGDRYEYWLLDGQTGLPLALLASACCAAEMTQPQGLDWRPGEAARQYFRAPSRGGYGTAAAEPHADLLAGLIRAAAGARPAAQWFLRDAMGPGQGLEGVGLDPAWIGRHLPAASFPELLLRVDWPRECDARLVRDFFDWQAPWLLTLQSLSETSRANLEQIGFRQALRVAQLYRLYPVILDEYRLRAALVEARLRTSQGTDGGEAVDCSTSTAFFVTGN
jgi:hypothetical protein